MVENQRKLYQLEDDLKEINMKKELNTELSSSLIPQIKVEDSMWIKPEYFDFEQCIAQCVSEDTEIPPSSRDIRDLQTKRRRQVKVSPK